MALKMSDKLQFVASFCHSPSAERLEKLKFVGHFWIRQRYRFDAALQRLPPISMLKLNTIALTLPAP